MEQETNNTFEYVQLQESTPMAEETKTFEITSIEEKQLAEDFVTGLPSWDLTPPYEVIRRVTR